MITVLVVMLGLMIGRLLYGSIRSVIRLAYVKPCIFCDRQYSHTKFRNRYFVNKRSSLRGSTACTCDYKRYCRDPACHFQA